VPDLCTSVCQRLVSTVIFGSDLVLTDLKCKLGFSWVYIFKDVLFNVQY
jgi:hypothetical protein